MRMAAAIGLLWIAANALPGVLRAADDHVWDRATFGMTEEALQAAYGEDLRHSRQNESAAKAGGRGVFRLTRYYLVRQQFEDLDRCRVDFTFYQSHLAVVGFWCFGSTKEEIEARLREIYGPPSIDRRELAEIGWRRGDAYVSYNPVTGIISISDSRRAEKALVTLQQRLPSGSSSESPPPSGEPKPEEPSKGN